jgi:hypothetical protein
MSDLAVDTHELAWAAGFFDGEGCVTFRRTGIWTSICMSVSQADRGPLDRFRTAATIQTAIVCHLMAGRDEVLPKFSAFASLDRDNMPPSIWSLAKQLLDGAAGTRYDAWDVVCRAWRAFDPKNWEQQRLQLKGTEAPLSEMARVADAYQRAATSKTFRR